MLRSCLFVKCHSRRFGTRVQSHVVINEEIKYGLEHNSPIVALESTIITHGMPYPKNIECALEVERQIRKAGALPATIGILNGKLVIGLQKDEILRIGDVAQVKSVKTSRRDLAYVIANGLNGGTTVCGTLIACRLAGIKIFATGGLGGVHRLGEKTMDISADLQELSKSPVAVVSSGVKSILDIPKTLEYLETQGVFVSTYGSTHDFPAFYTRTSGCKSPYKITNAEEAANVIKTSLDLKLESGLLFAVPVPEDNAMVDSEINAEIEKALKLAVEKGIAGKEVTPFLLNEVFKITKGKSLETNMALVQNNARVAAEVAVALSKLQNSGNCISNNGKAPSVVVVGGSMLDRCVTVLEDEIKLDGRIHDGKITSSAGGVARNICDALNKFEAFPKFISAIGNDEGGTVVSKTLHPQQVTKYENARTAECLIVLDGKGDCKFLVGDMDIHKRITPDVIKLNEQAISNSSLVVLDGNPTIQSMEAVFQLALKYQTPVFFEPTDVLISRKPFEAKSWRAIKFITPNLNELKEIAQALNVHSSVVSSFPEVALLAKLVAEHIDNVIVTIGDKGLIIARKASAKATFKYGDANGGKVEVRHYPAAKVDHLVNVSGAGDCFAAGFITALLAGKSEELCVSVGFAGALCALTSPSAVPAEFFRKDHKSWFTAAKYSTIQL